jgi:hypothetical protein
MNNADKKQSQVMTGQKIAKKLFALFHYAVIGEYEMTNQEARAYLNQPKNLFKKFNVIVKSDHLLIF